LHNRNSLARSRFVRNFLSFHIAAPFEEHDKSVHGKDDPHQQRCDAFAFRIERIDPHDDRDDVDDDPDNPVFDIALDEQELPKDRKNRRDAVDERQVGCRRRSFVETAMFRIKKVFGERLKNRTIENQKAETVIKARALYLFAALGTTCFCRRHYSTKPFRKIRKFFVTLRVIRIKYPT
jgi:hypothetical protein